MLATINSGSKKDAPQRVQFGNFDIMNDVEGRPLALGKGTFGRTSKARHRYLDTIVALKIINERYAADAGVRERFLTEARAVARLSHPHIARLYDFGEVDGVLHYAMEYCGGGSLADCVMKNGPFGVEHVVEVGQQIAGALKCAHGAGFIHRDLKPSNIMLTDASGPLFSKLIDFGLVQPSLPEATKSFSNDQSADGARFLGTPLFASPEQLKEEPMDVRTDLFSLGMTLWYLLLGRAPDTGSSAEIAARRLSPESYVTQLPANLSVQLRDVLARLLQKDRRNRFASAAEALAAFNACAAELGLRQTRDYTSATEGPEGGGAAVTPTPPQIAKAEPAAIERVEANLDSEFKIVTRVNDDFTGSNYVAESKTQSNGLVFLHVLHPALVEETSIFELLRVHVTQLKGLAAREILQPRALRAFSDYVSIVIDKPTGGDLLSILRTERVVPLAEAAPLLESIAAVCDRLTAAGLPGPQLAPAYIFVEWPGTAEQKGATGARQLSQARPKLYPRFLAVSEAPELARISEPEDLSSTMTSDMLGDPDRADNVCEHFGTLLYRMVAGRNCPIAASLSSQAYVAVPGLSEHSNRLLSLVIAKQIERTSCGQVLREIMAAEGIASREHSSVGSAPSGTGSTVAPPLRTPPKSSTGSTASSSRFRPMPVAPSAADVPPPTPVAPSPPPFEKGLIEKADALSGVGSRPTPQTPQPVAPSTADVPPPTPVAPSPPPLEKRLIEKADALSGVGSRPTAQTPQPVAPSTADVPPPTPVAPSPPPLEKRLIEKADALSGVGSRPDAQTPQPLTPPRDSAPAIAIPEPAPKPAEPATKSPAEDQIQTSTPERKPTKKPRSTVAKAKSGDGIAVEEEVRPEPPTTTDTGPSPLEKSTVVEERVAAQAAPPLLPKRISPPKPAIGRRTIVQDTPWLSRNVRPIGIGVAALLTVSLSYGVIQKIRSRNATTTSSIAQEPVVKPAQDIVPATVATPPNAESKVEPNDTETEKLAERAKEEQKAKDDAKVAAQKADDDAKVAAAQKAADDARLLAEQQKVQEPEAAANPKAPEAPKTRTTQKQVQKDSQSSRNSAGNRTSQPVSRPAPVAPVNRQPSAPRPTNNSQRQRSEFGPTAPGG